MNGQRGSRRQFGLALAALLMIAALPGSLGLVSAQDEPVAAQGIAAGAPTVVSYQGQVLVDGAPYTGTGHFKFAIVDSEGATTWSNDGTSAGGGEPTAAVSLAVSSGLFNVLLGDTSLTNMTALPASAFSGTERYLRVWFSSDGSTFVQLSPDRRIAAVPYALQAEEAKNAWALTGNAGTTPGTDYLGTSDNQALELKVNAARVLRLEPTATSPNLIGGYSGNWLTGGMAGAVIAGGGNAANLNRVTDSYGVVGGGSGNQAGDNAGPNSDKAYATVGGGQTNTASGLYATVGGGNGNTASNSYATVGGGVSNSASGEYTTVGGGWLNSASYYAATIGGGRENTASASTTTVGGGRANTASGWGATIAGGYLSTVAGNSATVGGGHSNSAGGEYATVPGGASNAAAGAYSFAAGRQAKANNQGCFVWADATAADFTCATDNQFAVRANGGVNFQTGTAAVQVNGSTVWHAGNDGTGSTLDADLLDGQHAAAFAAAGHNHDATYVNEAQAASITSEMIVDATVGLSDIGQNGCTGGQVMQWNGTKWACASVTGVTDHGALTGLTDDDHPQYFNLSQAEMVDGIPAFNGGVSGSTAPFSVDSSTLVTSLNADLLDGSHASAFAASGHNHDATYVNEGQSGSVTSAMLVDGASLAEISDDDGAGSTLDADLLDGQHAWQVGDALRRASRPAANITTVADSGGTAQVGQYTSITIGADGLPVASYYDATTGDLKVLHCGDAVCATGNTVTAADTSTMVGSYSSIAIGTDGLPVISYYNSSSTALKVVHCGNAACSSGNTITFVDSTNDVGSHTSIAIGADGYPVISCYDITYGDLKVAHCTNTACTSSTSVTVDSMNDVGQYSAIAIGSDGLPVISYYDATNGNLKVLHCTNVTCATSAFTTPDTATNDVGRHTSIAIGADGLPVISYYDLTADVLKVLHCGNVACGMHNTFTAVSNGGAYSSITIGAAGMPLISYAYGAIAHALNLVHCGDVACTNSSVTTVDASGSVGDYSAITIGVDGLPVISYNDPINDDLKVTHCGNAMCVPYWRQR